MKKKEELKKEIKKELSKEELKKKSGKTLSEFKTFIAKGNIMDLAVGVIIGGAFGKIVTSLVNDIIMPVIGVIIGGIDFTGLEAKIGDATITYGNFIQNVIDFLIVSICIFIFIKMLQRLTRKKDAQEAEEAAAEEPKKDDQVVLLEEIRDLLKENKSKAKKESKKEDKE